MRLVPAFGLLSALVATLAISPATGAQTPTPRAVPGAPIRVGGNIGVPIRIKYIAPVYPAAARAARIQGIVIIEATIDVDGQVMNATILRGIDALNESALEAVRQWKYTPTTFQGRAIAVIMTVTVNFSLGGLGQARGAAPPMLGRGLSVDGPRFDLTGTWESDDGGTYQIRTVGGEMFWHGTNARQSSATVFHGSFTDRDTYAGRWADVPPATSRNTGNIAVRALDENRLQLVVAPVSFPAHWWRRLGEPSRTSSPERDGSSQANVSTQATVVLPGAGITSPVPTYRPNPMYTREAMAASIQGTVVLSVVVRPDGSATDARVVRSLDPGLDQAAIRAAEQWRFDPGRDRDGRVVSVRVNIEMSFNLTPPPGNR